MSAVPKDLVACVDADKLVRRVRAGLFDAFQSGLLAHPIAAEGVEDFRVGDKLWVVGGAVGGGFDDDAGGDDLAVGEGDGLEDFTAE